VEGREEGGRWEKTLMREEEEGGNGKRQGWRRGGGDAQTVLRINILSQKKESHAG
jgi:hypothetical protein